MTHPFVDGDKLDQGECDFSHLLSWIRDAILPLEDR